MALLGARQVGKTTLARTLAAQASNAVYLDLESRPDRLKLNEPELFLAGVRDRLVILDEIQTVPDLFRVLRPEIDADRRPGRFLLLGSASPMLLRQSSESLAGRIAFHELSPLLIDEVRPDPGDLQSLWVRGGFPNSFTAPSDPLSYEWRTNFIRTFLERDLPQLGITVPAETLSRFWRMLAHNHGQLLNASQLGAALGVTHSTIARYLDILTGALVVRRLEPLHANLGKRLVKSPKIYLRDSGILHALLDIRSELDLQGHPIAGHSWEGFVLEQLCALSPPGTDVTFYRTVAGAELDVVLTLGGRRFGFEIKYSAAPKPKRGFWTALEDLGIERGYVVAPVQERFPLSPQVEVISPLDLGTILRSF
ncbi:MAG: ATP-binding protein [Myxococcaceae bacterium]